MFVDISRSRGRRSCTSVGTGGGDTGLELNNALVVSAAEAVGDKCRNLSANAEPTLRCHGSLPDDHGSTLEAGGDQGGAEIKFSAATFAPGGDDRTLR